MLNLIEIGIGIIDVSLVLSLHSYIYIIPSNSPAVAGHALKVVQKYKKTYV